MSTARRISRTTESEKSDAPDNVEAAILAGLEELEQFGENWNGYGAPPPDPGIISAVRTFARSLPDRIRLSPQVVPMTRGRVQLEWHRGRRSLELEFETPDQVHFLKWDPEADVEEEGVLPADDTEALVGMIDWFDAERTND